MTQTATFHSYWEGRKIYATRNNLVPIIFPVPLTQGNVVAQKTQKGTFPPKLRNPDS